MSNVLARAVLLSMSAGSFWFISLIELLPAGLDDGRFIKSKLATVVAGFAVVAILAIWV